MLDISAARAKERAAKFEFDSASYGPAGYESTRREPPMLSDRQRRTLDQFVALVRPWQRRTAYFSAVLARLSGRPGDAAVYSAAINASAGLIDSKVLAAHGLVIPHSRPQTWKSKAVMGTGR
jgi:hypothetical protein